MSIFHNNGLIGASGQGGGAGGYSISRSLRFNSSDSAYLSRTPASAGNRKTWTWAGWVKRSGTGAVLDHIFLGSLVTDAEGIRFNSSDKIQFYLNGGSFAANLITTQVFRDFSAWYHIVVAVDTTQATASNRVKLYINGSQITAFDTSTYPSQNYDCPAINTTAVHWIGANIAGPFYSNFYLADCYLIDGSALTPSSFTETDATTGQLVKKAYTGSFTGNSFYLTFEDNSAATAAALGKDSSGLGNNWTPNNLSVTAGAGNDSLVDVPTNGSQTDTGVGGEVRGNYAVLLDQYVTDKTRLTMANGNLDVTFNNSGSSSSALSSIGVSSGKWYSEFTCTQTGSNYAFVGIASPKNNNIDSLGYGDSYAYVSNTGNKANNGSFVSYGATWTANDVIGVALDLDAGTITFYKNGVSQGQAYSSISGTYIIGCTGFLNWKFSANFGQRPFAYTAPSGFKALCTANLPAPVVAKPNTVFDVKLYTGNGSTQTISGLGFSPDLVWIKNRSAGGNGHFITDTPRFPAFLSSDATAAEQTQTGFHISALNSDGFSLQGNSGRTNTSGDAFAAWTWDAGSSTVTNTQGSITSSVRANASAGFSIVTYSGNSTAGATVGHGLNVAPSLIIVKSRTATAGYLNWGVYHASLGNTKVLYLNTTGAESADSNEWNNTSPTSTVFSLGFTTGNGHNVSGQNYVAYCFAPVVGYSSFGTYVANSSADGPFIYTGFRPKLVIVKCYDSTSGWALYDSARGTYNTIGDTLLADSSNQENNPDYGNIDFLSNGFKIRSGSGYYINNTPDGFIYCAWAESPFQYARAR